MVADLMPQTSCQRDASRSTGQCKRLCYGCAASRFPAAHPDRSTLRARERAATSAGLVRVNMLRGHRCSVACDNGALAQKIGVKVSL